MTLLNRSLLNTLLLMAVTFGTSAVTHGQEGGSIVLPVCRIMQGEYEVFFARQTKVPPRLPIGVSTAYNNGRHNIESVWHPIPANAAPGKMLNLTSFGMGVPLPKRFIIGDGALTRAFFLIDQQEGTKLDAILNMFVGLLPGVDEGRRVVNEKLLLSFLQRSLDMLVNFRWRPGIDGRGENKWDPKRFVLTAKSRETFKASVNLRPSSGYYATEQQFPTVAYESFLEQECAAYCIQKAMLVKLLLDRVGVRARLVTGSVLVFDDGNFKTSGHSWVDVERSDGKIWVLDPEQELLGPRGERNEHEADWYWFNGVNRRENANYPVMVQAD